MISDRSTCLMALASEGKSGKSLSSESSAPLLVLQKKDLFALGRTVSFCAKMTDEWKQNTHIFKFCCVLGWILLCLFIEHFLLICPCLVCEVLFWRFLLLWLYTSVELAFAFFMFCIGVILFYFLNTLFCTFNPIYSALFNTTVPLYHQLGLKRFLK